MRKKIDKVLVKNTRLEKKVIGYITFFIMIFVLMISLLFIITLRENMISQATNNIIYNSESIANEYNALFEDYNKSGIALNNSIKRRVITTENPPPSIFDAQRIKRSIDGSIRIDDDDSGAFLAKGSSLSNDLNRYFFFSKRSFEVLGPIAKSHFFNFYFITEENFIRITPKDWAMQIEANHNFEHDIFYKIADPENNPQRIPRWTPLYFDSIWKRWMTSLIIPIYKEDDFIGITGSDIILDTIFDNISKLKQKTKIYNAVIFDSYGNLIIHPKYEDEILNKRAEMNTLLNINELRDPILSEIINGTIQQETDPKEICVTKNLKNSCYFSSHKISAMDWYVGVYAYKSDILNPIYSTIVFILSISLILGLLIIVVLRNFLKKLVLNRISSLGQAVSKISKGDLNSQIELSRDDEIGILETGFMNMQSSLANQFEELKTNAIELKKREMKYRTLIETTSEGFWLMDIDEKTIDVNQSICNMMGYSRDEMIGRSPLDFVDDENREIFIKSIDSYKRTEHRNYEIALTKKDGTNFPTLFNATTLLGENGKPAGAFSFVTDITLHKQASKALQESEKRFRNLSNLTFEGILIHEKGVAIDVNESLVNMLDYPKKELIGKNVIKLFIPEEYHLIIKENLVKESAKPYEVMAKKKDGTLVPIEIEAKNIKSENKIIRVAAIRDISQRKQAEKEILEKSKELKKQFKESEKQRIATLVILNDLNKTTKNLKKEIGEHKLAEEKEKELHKNIELLSETAMQFIDLSAGDNIYHFIAQKISEYLGRDAYVLVNSTTDEKTITTKAITGIGKHSEQLINLLGRNPLGNVINITGSGLDYLKDGKIHCNEKGLYEICLGTIPKPVCKSIEKLTKIGDIYTAGIVKGKQLLGTIVILMKKNCHELININFLETFIKQAAITVQKRQAERSLIESEKLSAAVIEDSPLGISVRDKFGTLILYNEAWKNIWGFTDEQVESYKIKRTKLQMNKKDGYLGKHQLKIREIYENGGTYYIPEIRLKPSRTKKAEWIMQRFYAIKDENNKMEKVVVLTADISARKRADIIQKTLFNISNALNTVDNLHELFIKIREYMGNILDTTNFYIALYDEKTDIISLPFDVDEKDNFETFPAGKSITKYVINIGKPLFATKDVVRKLIKKGLIETVGSPSEIWLGVPLEVENKVIGVIALQSYDNPNLYSENDIEILTFISEEIALAIKHKQDEDQLISNLNEKSTLLQEIFHRTKNNMQLISAMLSMQARRSDNEFVNTTFKEIINKIRSMSLVHQKLYQAKDLSNINLKEYIEDLMRLLTQSYGSRVREVSFKFDLENVFILMDSAVPIGLILNELVSNVFKHAFPDSKKGEICISLYKGKDDLIDLQFDDNGVGIPKHLDIRKECSMGLNTVFTLVEHQLNGKVNIDTENGLKWHITFRDDQHKERV